MSVKEEDVIKYLSRLGDWREINVHDERITVAGLQEGTRSTYGQTTAAFRHAKKTVKELRQYTSIKESQLLGNLHNALLGIPDINPEDIKDFSKIGGVIKALRSIGDFNHKQLAIIEWGERWIEFGDCSASEPEIIKKAVFAIAFLLKSIEYDLDKDINKPFVKVGITLLDVEQRKNNLDKVKEFIGHLERKSLKPATRPKFDKQAFLLRHRVKELEVIDTEALSNLKIQLDELSKSLLAEKKEVIDEYSSLKQSSAMLIEEIIRIKKGLTQSGVQWFWENYQEENVMKAFLDGFVTKDQHPAWLRAFYYQKDVHWFNKKRQSSWEDDVLWRVVQTVDGFFSYLSWSISITKNVALKQLFSESISVTSLNQTLDNKLAQIIDEYTSLAPGENYGDNKTEFILNYHNKRLKELTKIELISHRLKEQLQRKEVSKFLKDYIQNTSWWLWLCSSEYRKVTSTVLNILYEDQNPSAEKLKLVYEVLERGAEEDGILSSAKLRIEQMMLESFELISAESLPKLLPMRPVKNRSSAISFVRGKINFFQPDQTENEKKDSSLTLLPTNFYSQQQSKFS